MTLVSIVMPVKNTSQFLRECLDSIVDQTYSDWELLVVDDHSTDKSWDIINEYSKTDSRIKLFKNIGHGIISALQLAYHNSYGSYITRMDSDDIMSLDKLELMVNRLEAKGRNHIVVGLVKYFHDETLGEGYKRYENWLNDLTSSGTNFDEIYKECSIPSPCWMISRADFEKCGGFNSDIYPEDYDLAFRFRKAGLQVAGISQVLHYWRDYSSRSSRVDDNYSDNKFTDLKVKHFISQDLDTPLLLWGAGRKGKAIAKSLVDHGVVFDWYCDNDSKIGKDIYGVILKDYKLISGSKDCQIIISISAKSADQEIEEVVGRSNGCSFYWFT